MRTLVSWMFATALPAAVLADEPVTILRRTEAKTGVVWDMPTTSLGADFLAAAAKQRPALYQQWRLGGDAWEALVDLRLAGASLPAVDLKIRTLDPDGETPRTRVDQGFTVEIGISGLLSGLDLPPAMSRLLLERHLSPAAEMAPAHQPHSRAYLTDNGRTTLSFPASALTATDATRARGEEIFTIHTLAGSGKLPSQLASARVRILPVAYGEIHGIHQGDTLDASAIANLTLTLKDLYPHSDTHLLLFKGRQYNGNPATVITSCPLRTAQCEDRSLNVTDLGSKITDTGFHTLALVSDTLYGRELLCDPITFQVRQPQPALALAPAAAPTQSR